MVKLVERLITFVVNNQEKVSFYLHEMLKNSIIKMLKVSFLLIENK